MSGVQHAKMPSGIAQVVALRLNLLPWFLIAAAPVIFAAMTWNPIAETNSIHAAVRLFGLPIAALELCVVLIVFGIGWRPIHHFRSLSSAAQPLLAFLVLIAFSTAVLAPKPASALLWTYLSLMHLLFGFAVAFLVSRAEADERRLIWPSIVAGLCGFWLLVIVFVNLPHPPSFDWRYLGLGVSNVRQLGFYSAVGTAAALGLAVQRGGRETLLWVAAGALVLSIAFWSGSRGALLALAAAVCLVLTMVRQIRTFRTAAIVLATAALAAGLSLLQPPPDHHYGVERLGRSLSGRSLNELGSHRVDLWLDAWNAFLSRPFFGYGEGQVGWVVPQGDALYLHPHNIYLQLLLQWGIVGTSVALALALILFRHSHVSASRNIIEALPAILVMLTLVIFSLYDGSLFHTYPMMMFAFSVAILGGTTSRVPRSNSTAEEFTGACDHHDASAPPCRDGVAS